jgi:hypothetical protein
MRNTFEFSGVASGDGECFCFFVDKDTYIKLCGQDQYEFELSTLKEFHEECRREEPFEEPQEWPVYPHKFFVSGHMLNIKIEVDATPIEVQ